MTTRLSLATLGEITDTVSKPTYSRSGLSAGIVHVGVGNFHRAHLGMYLHRLFEKGTDHNWAIVGAGIKDADSQMRERLDAQDWLTTVVELDPKGLTATISGSMIDFVSIDVPSLIEAMCEPGIRIVSLTVTEGGYYIDAQKGQFDDRHPDIVSDTNSASSPSTIFGILVAALRQRREQGDAPFTIMSCDNLPNNGDAAKQAVLGIARQQKGDFHQWLEDNVEFPNSMVDCITPATTEREKSIVKRQFGIDDAAPVVCEPFRQWVLEDRFSAGRPDLEQVGVEFVEDVASYELMKLRILNGGHAAIAYPAALLDIHYVHDAMQDAGIAQYLDCLEFSEIIPTVPTIAGVDFRQYYDKIVDRFSNEAIGDTIPRLCFDGANRQPKFILPVLEARLSAARSVNGLALESALWCRYCFGTSDAGLEIPPNDPNWKHLKEQATLAKSDPVQWLTMKDVYGDLGSNAVFQQAFENALNSLWQQGTRSTLGFYCSSVHQTTAVQEQQH